MQTFHKALLTLVLVFCSTIILAQDRSAEITELTNAGIKLHDQGKFDDAIAKYAEALKIDPTAANPLYETAYSYYQSARPDQAITYLERLIKVSPKSAGAYDMLGNIYDDKKVYDKALYYYNEGVKADSTYQRLHFNLSIFHFRQKAYAEAEKWAISAIKLDPSHASSHRVYALATLNLNKRAASLFGWCSFLLLEAQSGRSADAVNYVKHLVNFGIKRDPNGNVKTTVSATSDDLMFSLAVVSATTDKKGLSSVDSLALQLKSIFEVQDASKETVDKSFYNKFFVEYFKNMATSGNVPAFTRYITLSTNKEENNEWFKAHDDDITKLDKWVTTTKRTYE